MFNHKNTNPTAMQEEITRVIAELKNHDVSSEEYKKVADQLEQLYKIDNTRKGTDRVSPDALIAAITSLTGIVAILGFEHAGVITSKALGFVTKVKI